MKYDRNGKVNAEFLQKHADFLKQAKQGNIGLLFLGDSITAGWFWGHDRDIWNKYFAPYNPANFGIGGDQTQHVLWRIENGELDGIHPKVVVLLIGTNNIGYPEGDILRGDLKIIDEIHNKLPQSRLLIMAIFPRGAKPANANVAAMREKIVFVNTALAKLDDGDKTRYLDLGPKLLAPDGSLPGKGMRTDALHLNYNGYQIWASTMQPLLDEMVK